MSAPRTAYNPIHPSARSGLDPEYVAFHDEYVQYIRPDDQKAWDPAIRETSQLPYSGIGATPVGGIVDFSDYDGPTMRVFTPVGSPDRTEGWPLLLWFHGGGFVLGGIGSDVDFLTKICAGEFQPRLSPGFPSGG
jgi:acetyl esterase/lipase